MRLVRETGRPITQVARDLGISEGTLGSWVNADWRRRDGGEGQLSEDEGAELVRLRRENAELVRLRRENAELTMERDVARDQFGALLLSNELVFSPGHAETLAVWYQLAHWTAQAANDAAKQDIVTRTIRLKASPTQMTRATSWRRAKAIPRA